MRGTAAALVLLLACAAPRNGLKNGGTTEMQAQEGCDRDRMESTCNGLGYDDIGLVVGGAAFLAFAVIAKLVQR